MDGAQIIDLAVVLTLLAALLAGWARGLGRTLGGLAGAALGALVALTVVVPWVHGRVEGDNAPLALFVVCVVAIGIGAGLGTRLGEMLRHHAQEVRLGWLDALGGALTGGAVVAIVWTLVVPLAPLLGSAAATDSVGESRTLQTLTRVVPDSLQERTTYAWVLERSRPWLAEVAGSPATPPEIPDVDVDTAAVREASRSVVRISGDREGCHSVVTGSGFVVAPGRVMTNAHVVAGVSSPVVRAPGELPVRGTVVYVDEANDLAVIASDGLTTAPLTLRSGARSGSEGVVAGYPRGGPLRLDPAEIGAQRRTVVSIDGEPRPRRVLTLAADIDQGNSGGPVLGADGRVVGVVFAKSVDVDKVAFAVPVSVAGPVVERAASLRSPVDTGTCEAA